MSRRRPLSSIFSNTRMRLNDDEAAAPKISLVKITPRTPVPLDQEKPSIAQLPDPVVRRILTYLHELRPKDIHIIAFLSSSLYEQARYIEHHEVHINLDKRKHVLDRLRLIARLDQLAAVRKICLTGMKDNEVREDTKEIFSHLAAILPAMTGLRVLEWDVGFDRWPVPNRNLNRRISWTSVAIPSPILTALHASVRLYASFVCREGYDSHVNGRLFLNSLVNNQNLHSLSITICFIEEGHCVGTMRELKKVMVSCPNLTRIPNIDVFYPRGGCIGYGPPIVGPYCGFGFTEEDNLPVLEEIGLQQYPWGIHGAQFCQGYRGGGYEWLRWGEIFDWSRLVRVNDVPEMLASIAPKATNLRELYFKESGCIGADFFQDLYSPLEIMSLSGFYRVDCKPELITRFGDTLKHLTMHELESSPPCYGPYKKAKTPDLVQLSRGLPHLEHLALDIDRDNETHDWPYASLDAIAAFPQLRTVEIWFPLGKTAGGPEPYLTASAAKHLFTYLRARNDGIERATLHSGAVRPFVDSYWAWCILPYRPPMWDKHSDVSFVCEMGYNANTPEVRLSCLGLDEKFNDKLRQLLMQEGREAADPALLVGDELQLRVALDGPLNKDEWDGWMREYSRRQKEASLARQAREKKAKTTLQRLKRVWKR